MKKSQIIKILVCFLPLLLLLLPAPAGMNPKAWELFPCLLYTSYTIVFTVR